MNGFKENKREIELITLSSDGPCVNIMWAVILLRVKLVDVPFDEDDDVKLNEFLIWTGH